MQNMLVQLRLKFIVMLEFWGANAALKTCQFDLTKLKFSTKANETTLLKLDPLR